MRFVNRWMESKLLAAFSLLFMLAASFVLWARFLPTAAPDYRVQFFGLILDVLFIMVLLEWFESHRQQRRERRQDISRQEEVIEDFKRWQCKEASIRLAGAMRRLNRLGVTRFSLKGLQLADFDFAEHEIEKLDGTQFYDGTWGEPLRRADIALRRVKFDWVSCRDVQFSPYNPFGGIIDGMDKLPMDSASLTDCSFIKCDLSGSSFNGASLFWSERPPKSHYEYVDDDEYGNPQYGETSYGPFYGADLSKASFNGVHFRNADFRGADNIDEANFRGAFGLEHCEFDSDEIKERILAQAKSDDKPLERMALPKT